MSNYPAFKYHEEKSPYGVIVNNHEEEKALGGGWVDSPDRFVRPRKPRAQQPVIVAPQEPVKAKENPKVEPSKEPESVLKAIDGIELPRKRSKRGES